MNMNKYAVLITAVVAVNSLVMADKSEEGVPTSPLTTYSGGVGAGALRPLNDELEGLEHNFFKLTILNTLYFRENVGFFLDIDWFAPGSNFGADLGLDYFLAQGDMRPFIGAGAGAHYFEKKTDDFGENFGPSGTVHLGCAFDVSDRLQVQVRVPYHFVATREIDHGIGLDIGLLFSDKFRHVKKYDYNKK
jgi:hypothetical protein